MPPRQQPHMLRRDAEPPWYKPVAVEWPLHASCHSKEQSAQGTEKRARGPCFQHQTRRAHEPLTRALLSSAVPFSPLQRVSLRLAGYAVLPWRWLVTALSMLRQDCGRQQAPEASAAASSRQGPTPRVRRHRAARAAAALRSSCALPLPLRLTSPARAPRFAPAAMQPRRAALSLRTTAALSAGPAEQQREPPRLVRSSAPE
jgi:hypothetical protein